MSIGVIAASSVLGAAAGDYSAAVLADTPLAYYRLGETSGTSMVDSSGNGRHGVAASGITLGATGLLPGDANTCYDFSTSSNVYHLNAAWMDTAAITVEAVIQLDTVLGCNIAARDNSPRLYQAAVTSAGKLQFVFWTPTSGPHFANGATTLVPGVIYHVAYTYDGTTAKVWLNGVEDGSVTVSGGLKTGPVNLVLGRYEPDGALGRFDGRMDEVAFYGSALSAARIAAHAAAARSAYAREVMTDSPAVYLRMSEASGTVMTDASGNNRPGTYTGSPGLQTAGLLTSDPLNKAVNFSGTGQYADVPYGAWQLPGPFTAEAIVKPDVVTGTRNIMGRHHSSQYQLWDLGIVASKFRTQGRIGTSGTLVYELYGTTTLVAGTAYHVALTWDGTTRKLYVNGVLEASDTNAPGAPASISLGVAALSAGYGNTQYFDGVVDEVAFYPTALSAARIAAHAAAR